MAEALTPEEPKKRESKVKSAEEILGPSDDEAAPEDASEVPEAPVEEVFEPPGPPTGVVA